MAISDGAIGICEFIYKLYHASQSKLATVLFCDFGTFVELFHRSNKPGHIAIIIE